MNPEQKTNETIKKLGKVYCTFPLSFVVIREVN